MARRSPWRARFRFAVDLARRLFVTAILLCAATALAGAAITYREINRSLPPTERIVEYQPPVATQVFAANGEVIAEFYSEKRYLVPVEQIPDVVRNAFIAAEDDGFYEHTGIEPISILRAFVNNLLAGGRVQGGSTITQQVVKQLLLTPEKSYERKLKEVLLALRLEQQLDKDDILALYLNHIYLGSGAYGIVAAARVYFDKDMQELNLAEAALLAGLPQAPSRYSPFRNWPEAKVRQRYVIGRMYQSGLITAEQREDAERQPIVLASHRGDATRNGSYFVEHLRRMLESRYGSDTLYRLGLRVHSTFDAEMQRAAEATLREGLEELSQRHSGYRSAFRRMTTEERDAWVELQNMLHRDTSMRLSQTYEGRVTATGEGFVRVRVGPHTGTLVIDSEAEGTLRENDLIRVRVVDFDGNDPRFTLDPSPPVEGALVALDPKTGDVRAMVGGYDFARSQFNRAVQARRQPGSAFKPFVFAAALDRHFTPASVIVDEPIHFFDNGRVWSPQNYGRKFHGPTTLRRALTFSRNVVTVKLADRIGVRYLVRYLRRLGLPGPFAPNLSLALGSAEVSPLEIATAYGIFANQGRRAEPRFITRITDPEGNVLEEVEPEVRQVISPATAYQVTSMLQDVVERGTGRRARGLNRPTAGKTGTTNDTHDNWFVGYTPQLLAAVWVGFDTRRSLGGHETGGRTAAPIWKAFMESATRDDPIVDFSIPDGLRCVHVDPETGTRALPGSEARLECFQAGQAPAPPPPIRAIIDEDGEAPPPSVGDFLRNDL